MIRNKDTKFTKLFVGGIPYESDDDALRNFFGQFGEIEEAVVIRDRFTKKSKGYGFVTMTTSDAAALACKNKRPMIDGRQANVNLAYLGAKPKPARIPGKLSTNPTYSFQQACAVGSNPQYVFAPLYTPPQSQSPMSPLSIIPPQSPNGIVPPLPPSYQQPCYVDYGGGAMVVFNTVYDPYYYQPATTYVPSPTGNNNVNQVFTFPTVPTGPPTPPLSASMNGINGQAFIQAAAPFEMVGQPQVQCQ